MNFLAYYWQAKKIIVILFFISIVEHSLFADEPANLIANGDFEQVTAWENLWDGVDGQGRIKVFGYSAPQMADLTGDGLEDLLIGDEHGWLWYYKNAGTKEEPKFTSGEPLLLYAGLFAKPCFIDWDNDGLLDLLIGDMGGHVYVVTNAGKQTNPRFYYEPGSAEVKTIQYGDADLDLGQYVAPAVSDFSGDGKKDLLLGEGTYSANSVYLYINSGSDSLPKFAENSRFYLAYGDGREHLVPYVIDWNKDGALDLIVGENLGYINLYLRKKIDTTRAKSVFDKPGIEPLLFTERLRHEGGDLWGERVSPCVIDWDKDGDMDIVFGDRSGLVYLSKNIGSEKEPKFAKPVSITGDDTMHDGRFPVGWDPSFSYHRAKPNGGRKYGGAFIATSTQEAQSGQYALEVKCLFNYPCYLDIYGSITKPIKVENKYRFTFYVKGEDMEMNWNIWYTQHAETEGVRGYETFSVNEEVVSLGPNWSKVTKTFKFPGKKKGGEFDCSFRISLTGDGDISIDNISLVEE